MKMTNASPSPSTITDLATQWGLPDSEVASAGLRLVADVSPAFLTNHCVRSYLFSREIAAAQKLLSGIDYDEETLYLACLLHDLGLTEFGAGEQRFEVEGADAAVRFLGDYNLPEDKLNAIWQAIALHASIGLFNRFGPVPSIAGSAISFDIDGRARDLFAADFLERVNRDWPRHDVGYAIVAAIAEGPRSQPENPLKAPPFSLSAHAHEAINGAPHFRFSDIVQASGWGDQVPGF